MAIIYGSFHKWRPPIAGWFSSCKIRTYKWMMMGVPPWIGNLHIGFERV
jgi:hypothetical protein